MGRGPPPPQVAATLNRYAPGALAYFTIRMNIAHQGIPVTLTSWYRTPDQNEQARMARTAAGFALASTSPFSQHLVGLGVDMVYPNTRAKAAARAAAQKLGLVVIDEGNHVHYQLFPKGVLERTGVYRAVGFA